MKVEDNTELLYKPFDVEMHADNFICYCEVVIHPNGLIEYATPSHERKLISICSKKYNISDDDVINHYRTLCYDVDHIEMLMIETGCILVWYDHLFNATNLTKEQHEALQMLMLHKCISDRCLDDIQSYLPYANVVELRRAHTVITKKSDYEQK